MAEAKREYHYDMNQAAPQIEQPNPSAKPSTPPRPEIIRIPSSPARKLKRISGLEKIIGIFLLAAVIGLAVLTVYVRTDISQLEREVSQIEAQTTQQAEEKTRLEQEKSELSKTERIKKIAEKKGLKINDDNLRKVK
ncbi:cell division protein FtsL [Enterococcus sp. MJM12]|uniref:Cell division protein FtsL n=1 Tax=Candidatus Enterococcus myersii TaxID=2815322 RepID=A0ABS3H8N9_9ENTE|nr:MULTISPECIES: cell division protein FtsL [Enterococcus]MBO0449815.1 cell division protein FtsL [Enterococcus sp. MJM12]MCD1023728.1 cell division protein FtsL [Enterococcus sp. SMC-9]WHA08471.1 cell division protein FtsL [Enterococcus montenegrensis]